MSDLLAYVYVLSKSLLLAHDANRVHFPFVLTLYRPSTQKKEKEEEEKKKVSNISLLHSIHILDI